MIKHDFMTLQWGEDETEGALYLTDQTKLPHEKVLIKCLTVEDVVDAISTLKVRGAPAIGVTAAYGMALGAREILPQCSSDKEAIKALETVGQSLRATRPTAVNLQWAVEDILNTTREYLNNGGMVADLPDAILARAQELALQDRIACDAMGKFGAELISPNAILLTHCNAGALATSGIGSALAPMFVAHKQGKQLHVYVDETRPILQGARLTAWELRESGIPCTLITDSMAAYHMKNHHIQAVFVGADRVAANGDVANKIGTYGLAIIANYHHIPLYVVAPVSTIDVKMSSGEGIPIEQRNPKEVTHIQGQQVAPDGMHVSNPAFDVTPANLVAAIITEKGIARPPFSEALSGLMKKENVG